MTTIHVEYYGFQGEGPTVKAAKEDAGKKIAALHRDNWTPVIREWRGHAALVFRTLRGWEYRFIARPDQLPPLHIPMGSCPGDTDRAETIFTAERHIAANGWEPTDELDVFPVWFGTDSQPGTRRDAPRDDRATQMVQANAPLDEELRHCGRSRAPYDFRPGAVAGWSRVAAVLIRCGLSTGFDRWTERSKSARWSTPP